MKVLQRTKRVSRSRACSDCYQGDDWSGSHGVLSGSGTVQDLVEPEPPEILLFDVHGEPLLVMGERRFGFRTSE